MVNITTSDSWSTVVAAQSAGTTFDILAGTHRNQTFTHKAGNIYNAVPEADIRGTVTVADSDWIVSGSNWYIELPTMSFQTTSTAGGFNISASVTYRPYINIDLFEVSTDGETWRPFVHKTTTTGLAAYEFYLDTAASPDRLYIGTNPAAFTNLEVSGDNEHLCETTVTGDFTWKGGRIRGYRCTQQNGALFLDNITSGTVTVDHAVFEWNHWKGLTAAGAIVRNCRTNYNGQLGISLSGEDCVWYNSTANYNNTWLSTHLGSESAYYNMNWEAGAIKFVNVRRLIIDGCEMNYNGGPGCWLDIDNYGAYVKNIIVIGNYRPHGIYSEIGGRATFDNCFIADNGINEGAPSGSAGVYGAQIRISNTCYNTVKNCTIIVPDHAGTDVGGGIGITYTDRGDTSRASYTTDSGEVTYIPRNNRIFNNNVYFRAINRHEEGFNAYLPLDGTTQAAAFAGGEYYNNKWWNNVYHRRSGDDTTTYVYQNAGAGNLAAWNGSAFTRGSGDTENYADDAIPAYPTRTAQQIWSYTDKLQMIGALVQHFPFHTDLTDDSGYGIDATTAGSVGHATSHALADGSGYAEFTSNFADMATSIATELTDYELMRITIFAFYYRDTSDGATTWQDIWHINESSGSGAKYNVFIDPSGNNELRFVTRTDGGSDQQDTTGTQASVYDTWRTVAQRLIADHPDGAAQEYMRGYINGTQVVSETHTAGALTVTSLGKRRIAGNDGGSQVSQIDMAHFAIFADALQTGELVNLSTVEYPSPIVTLLADQSDTEGDGVSLSVVATDPNSLTLTYGATGLPAGATINTGTGAITGTLSGTSAGRYYPVISVTNSESQASTMALEWIVADGAGNPAPVWFTIGNKSNAETNAINLTVSVSDSETNTITIAGLPTGLSYVDNGDNTATITGLISVGASVSSPFSVTATADDGTNAAVDEAFTWTVSAFSSAINRFGDDGCIDCDDVLMLLVGVPAIEGDVNTNDEGEGQLDYFTLDDKVPLGANREILWTPNIAAPEGGGAWQQGIGTSGRVPYDLSVGNVSEIIQLYYNTPSYTQYARAVTRAQRIVSLAREFNTTYGQIKPVYLKWRHRSGRDQYALIKNMNAVFTVEDEYGNYNIRVSIDIEREAAWRPLPPFSNPKLWSLYVAGTQQTPTNVNLISESDDLISATIKNKHEYDSTDYNGAPLSKNWIDIPAALIPGDAPALVQVYLKIGASWVGTKIFISASSKPVAGLSPTGDLLRNAYTFNAGDARYLIATGITSMTKTSGFGVFSNASNVTQYGIQLVVPASTSAPLSHFSIGDNGSGNFQTLDAQLLRGRYAVFVRGGGVGSYSAGAVSATFLFGDDLTNIHISGETVGKVIFQDGENNLNYVGDIDIPQGKRNVVGTNGRGLSVAEPAAGISNVFFELGAFANTAVTSQTVRVVDFVLIPIDESVSYFTTTNTTNNPRQFVFDSTGYLTRYDSEQARSSMIGTFSSGSSDFGIIKLMPNRDYRLYFLISNLNISEPDIEMDVYINILPRWYGVRDV